MQTSTKNAFTADNKKDQEAFETPYHQERITDKTPVTINRMLPSRPDTPNTQTTPERRYHILYTQLYEAVFEED